MNDATRPEITLLNRLGHVPMTYSDTIGEWCSKVYRFEINNVEWSVEFSLDEKRRVALYAYTHNGENKFSPGAYTPNMTIETALEYTLGS